MPEMTNAENVDKLREQLRKRSEARKDTENKDLEKKKQQTKGTYDHTDEHSTIYSAMGIDAQDTPIDRAWARLEDRGHNIGPAMTQEIDMGERGVTVQYFLYYKALLNNSSDNVNQAVVFTSGSGKQLIESGI